MGEMIVEHDISHGLKANHRDAADGLRRRDTLNDRQRLDLLEIFEERYRRKSTMITAQLPVAAWHEMIGEATLADAILDRIVHNAHRITLEGDSMRKRKTPTLLTDGEITEINHP